MIKKLFLFITGFLLCVNSVFATNITSLNTFTSGTTIESAKVNANFETLRLGHNAQETSLANVLNGTTDFTKLDVDNLVIDLNTFSSITGDIVIAPYTGSNVNISLGDLEFAGTTRLTSAGVTTLTQDNIDNIRIDGNTISSTDTNGNITITANGTGEPIATNAANTAYLIKHFGDIYITAGAYNQTLTTQNTYYLVDAFGETGGANGIYRGVTVDKDTSKLTVSRAGYYDLYYDVTAKTGAAGDAVEFIVYKNGVAITTGTNAYLKIQVNAYFNSVSSRLKVLLAANDYLQLYARGTVQASEVLTVTEAHFSVEEI